MTPTKLSDPEHTRVILAMVDGNSVIAKLRENQLKDAIWPQVQTCQFKNTQESAWSMLDTILGAEPIKLQCIQDELERICNTLPTQFGPRTSSSWSFFSRLFSFKSERRVSASTAQIFLSFPPLLIRPRQ